MKSVLTVHFVLFVRALQCEYIYVYAKGVAYTCSANVLTIVDPFLVLLLLGVSKGSPHLCGCSAISTRF